MRCVRVAAVVSQPAPYRDPLFHKLSQKENIHFHAFFQFMARKGTAWGENATGIESRYPFDFSCFRDKPSAGWVGRHLSAIQEVFWIIKRLQLFSPDIVIIYGYFFPATWGAIIWALLLNKKYSLRSDSNFYIDRNSGWKALLKRAILAPIVRNAQSILYIGSANRLYWEKYGAIDDQLVEARYAVNDDLFFPELASITLQKVPVQLLFVGRLIERKNALLLLGSLNKLAKHSNLFNLTIIGAGPLESSVQQKINELGLNNVKFIGQVSPYEMPEIYRRHDILVCPYEKEPWGLTINEAMCCGLAVVAAIDGTCGAAIDLLVHKKNGYGLDNLNQKDLASSIQFMLDKRDLIPAMKLKSLDIISDWNYDTCLNGFLRAIGMALDGTKINSDK